MFLWNTTSGGFQLGRSTPAGCVRSVEKNLIGGRQTGCWWCKQAKVPIRPRSLFEAHGYRKLDQCAQIAGEPSLCVRSRKGLTEGLRNSVKVDNPCALEVGHLRKGSRSFEVRRPKCEEGSPGLSQGRSRGIDAQSGGSGYPEVVYQCRSRCT